jgi:epoxyqueuosine reductase
VWERAWAEAAGLGFVGKSAMFIHRRRGTWTFLGGLVTDLELLPTGVAVEPSRCGTCTRCIDACPTQAITAPGQVDARRCLTTWNVERPLHPDADHADLLGHGWAVGCDVCQEVCPWNRFQVLSPELRFSPRAGHVVVTSESLPEDVQGTALARPGPVGVLLSVERAREKRSRTLPVGAAGLEAGEVGRP